MFRDINPGILWMAVGFLLLYVVIANPFFGITLLYTPFLILFSPLWIILLVIWAIKNIKITINRD